MKAVELPLLLTHLFGIDAEPRPHSKPDSTVVPVTPLAEPDRVAPVWLTLFAEFVVTVAVGSCPRSSPPDPVQSAGWYVTPIVVIRNCFVPSTSSLNLVYEPVNVTV